MTEEVKQVVEDVKPEVETPAYTDIEVRALEMGWRPKEEFDGEEDDFIDAKEFVRRKPLFDKIDHQNRQLKELKKDMEALQSHYQRVRENEYKNALADLKAQYKQALESGDSDRVVEISETMAAVKAEEKLAAQPATKKAPEIPAEFARWVNDNKWYAEDIELRRVADSVGLSYAEVNPGTDPNDVLKYVTKKIKEMYPSKFRNANRDRPSPVEGGTIKRPARSSSDDLELSEDELRVMKRLVKSNVMTEAEYKDSIRKLRG